MSERTEVAAGPRRASRERTTGETHVRVALDLDGGAVALDGHGRTGAGVGPGVESPVGSSVRSAGGAGASKRPIAVPDGFFHHMLDALATHGGFGLAVEAEGDVEVDLHHTVEDVGLALGEAFADALGERQGIVRFAHAYAPLDEALARAVVDLSGRGFFAWRVPPELANVWVTQAFPLTLVADFFQAFADRGRLTLHLDLLHARNGHHAAEALFKAAALALRAAVALRGGAGGAVPSTKGTLTA
jgi:imidazoleglycerol-phosphate dehydratase